MINLQGLRVTGGSGHPRGDALRQGMGRVPIWGQEAGGEQGSDEGWLRDEGARFVRDQRQQTKTLKTH